MSQQPWWAKASSISRLHNHTHLDTPHSVRLLWKSDQPDAENSTCQHTIHTTDILPPAGFELTIPASERPQTHALGRAATGIGVCLFNPLTPNDHYSDHTAPLTSKRCILYIYSTNTGTEYFKHVTYSPFFLLKCSLFHNSNVFGSCFIRILYTGCAKIKKKKFRRQKINIPKYYYDSYVLYCCGKCECWAW